MLKSAIDIQDVLRDTPHFNTFCSVAKLHGLVERLSRVPRFEVGVAGTSVNGVAIHHVRFGKGSVKALFVGGPHCMEPVGSLTVFSLLSLLHQGNRALLQADVEWHVIPCLDPDGALLNEGWSQQPFAIERFVKNFYLQTRPEQVDFSFPIRHKQLIFDRPSREARVLQNIIDQVRPDFCFSLHNYGPMGGTWYALSRDIGRAYYEKIHELMKRNGITLQPKAPSGVQQFAEGMRLLPTLRGHYDHLERHGASIPDEYAQGRVGASSVEYLLEVNPQALAFVAELPYGQHPSDTCEDECGENLRQFKLRLFADNKFIASSILEEWDKTRDELDTASPFYRKVFDDLIAVRDRAHEGVTEWYEHPLKYVMLNPADSRQATKRDLVQAYVNRSLFLGNAYTFVRLLKVSKQTPPIKLAVERLEAAFDAAIGDFQRHIDFSSYKVTDCDTLARVQLGSGLIALDSVLASRRLHGVISPPIVKSHV